MKGWDSVIAMLILCGSAMCFGLYMLWDIKRKDRKSRLEEHREQERIASCTHPRGFTVVKVFGHPDLRKCRTCGRIFELSGEEVDTDYLEDFIENTDQWIENSDGGRELKIYLNREQFRKLYLVSMERKMTMDDMIGELIENYVRKF